MVTFQEMALLAARPGVRSVASNDLLSFVDTAERLAAALTISRPPTKQLLSMCKCSELFRKVLTSRVRRFMLKENVYCTAVTMKRQTDVYGVPGITPVRGHLTVSGYFLPLAAWNIWKIFKQTSKQLH